MYALAFYVVVFELDLVSVARSSMFPEFYPSDPQPCLAVKRLRNE